MDGDERVLIGLSVGLNVLLIVAAAMIVVSFGDLFGRVTGNRERRITQFELLTASRPSVVFVGDSITQGGLWHELFPGSGALNRGIGGDTTRDVLDRLDQVLALEPDKLFLMIGINDLNRGMAPDVVVANYREIFDRFDAALPNTRVYLQSVLPVNDQWALTDNADVPVLNAALRSEASRRGYTFVDLVPAFSTKEGELRRELSDDGIHLLGAGYALWREEIESLVMDSP